MSKIIMRTNNYITSCTIIITIATLFNTHIIEVHCIDTQTHVLYAVICDVQILHGNTCSALTFKRHGLSNYGAGDKKSL